MLPRHAAQRDANAISFEVVGDPVAQGSIKPVVRPQGGVWMKYPPKLKAWRFCVAREAMLAMAGKRKLEGALESQITFYLREPKRRVRHRPHVKPDLDKLCRAVFDALEGVVYENDAQITSLVTAKFYASCGRLRVDIGEVGRGRR